MDNSEKKFERYEILSKDINHQVKYIDDYYEFDFDFDFLIETIK